MSTAAALKIDDEFIRMRRVTRPDLMDKGQWLCGRLRVEWPHLQPAHILGWLTTCCDANEYFFVRTDKAFMLAQMHRNFYDAHPLVKEIFCFAETDNGNPQTKDAKAHQALENGSAIRQAASLYEDLLRWCQKMGADKIIIDECTDVTLEDKDNKDNLDTIRKRVNQRLFKREEMFFRTDPELVHKT